MTNYYIPNGQYFCDTNIYNSLAEAEANPRCQKVTLEASINSMLLTPSYFMDKRAAGTCDNKTVFVGIRSGLKYLAAFEMNVDSQSSDKCYMDYNTTKNEIYQWMIDNKRLGDVAFY